MVNEQLSFEKKPDSDLIPTLISNAEEGHHVPKKDGISRPFEDQWGNWDAVEERKKSESQKIAHAQIGLGKGYLDGTNDYPGDNDNPRSA